MRTNTSIWKQVIISIHLLANLGSIITLSYLKLLPIEMEKKKHFVDSWSIREAVSKTDGPLLYLHSPSYCWRWVLVGFPIKPLPKSHPKLSL
jgi:hypothetical protein